MSSIGSLNLIENKSNEKTIGEKDIILAYDRYYTIIGNDYIDYVIIAIILIFILLVWILIVYNIKKNITSDSVYLQCIPGECATNIYNGTKICPSNTTEMILIDPSYQVCNSRYTCSNKKTPFALNTDGSTNSNGICENNEICRCLSKASCPNDSLVLFNMINGTMYQGNPNNSRTIFQQIPVASQGENNNILFSDQNTQFCAMKAYHLNRIAPGGCIYADPNNVTLLELQTCMNNNPCMVGQIAFYPINSDNFILNNQITNTIYDIPVACVPQITSTSGHISNVCTGTTVPVYNKKTGKIFCYNTGTD
jgi:hypothetical protein